MKHTFAAISLIQSIEHSQIRIQVELKAGFVLEGETQQNNQGKLSFDWNMNYWPDKQSCTFSSFVR